MSEEQQQLMQAMDEVIIASKAFTKKRRKIVTPLHLRWSLHVLLLMIPFGAIMVWQLAKFEKEPLHISAIYVLSNICIGLFASLYVVNRTTYGKQLDALDHGDYQDYPELQDAVSELRTKKVHLDVVLEKMENAREGYTRAGDSPALFLCANYFPFAIFSHLPMVSLFYVC